MRLMAAAFLMGGLLGAPILATGVLTTEVLAAEKPPLPDTKASADTKAAPAKPEVAKPTPAKPVAHVPANRPVDYGDMRCGFAVRQRDVLDSQIIAWAGGFIEGYAKANPEHVAGRPLSELTDPAVLRTHIRGYCLKHREKSIEAALLAMMPHAPHAAESPAAPAQHPVAPK